jgi:predicted nucleic-acid-binding protein
VRAADTNLLVRYIVNDDRKQADAVQRLFRECRARGEAVFIPTLVLCELVWVLDRVYSLPKPNLIEVLESILQVGFFQFENEDVVRQALQNYRAGKASFPDYAIGEIGKQAGCRDTVTFDRALKNAPGFTLLT